MQRHSISFKNAARGIYIATTSQLNIRTHIIAATIVCLLAVWLEVSLIEGLILLAAIATVFVAEMINTALEFLANAVTMEPSVNIGLAKDVSAGAVLIAAIFSAIIGALIFVPKIIEMM